ncbi:actin-related protein ArpC4 [Volvox carteri f. nagariensis]|uniref:Actin-related protein 2/3 complex subunit 4 n=1 Tax=Volvox carteri f. nagariensis TaxID=3068 RepID=D8TI15_VOLCA|nr:actin-related protein ArpC4 [Volvox carteri f. nagariensis]EFJ52812.1 actin-related protein ArpC4 [Volvox carteri f. nagariensis]|eukprot:XP_002945817.1 actin-related protein ArpC4 [Volvox carteri f. nagariensis]
MALSLRPYTNNIRTELNKALCIQSFACQNVERHDKPEVESRDNPELLLPPVTITRSEKERCLIEASINSVRVSLRLGQMDMLEEELVKMYLRFLMQRAELLEVARRVPVEGYDVSFLITDQHLRVYGKQRLLDFMVAFIEEMDVETSSMKLAVNSRGRAVATEALRSLAF